VIDITPDELRKRMAEGKVYVPETARLASERFFKVENLTALRELALRRAAQTVDDQLVGAMREKGVEGPWAAGERILVLVGGDAMASSLVRAGRRLSDMMMDAPWTVAHVERPNRPAPDARRRPRAARGAKLAEQLGGATVTLTGDDVVATVMDYARATTSPRSCSARDENRACAFLGKLARRPAARGQGAAIHIITEGRRRGSRKRVPPPAPAPGRWRGYAGGARTSCGGHRLGVACWTQLSSASIWRDLLAGGGGGLAFLYGLRPALTARHGGLPRLQLLFLRPRYSLAIGSPTDVLTFACSGRSP
jgi:two-component system sensor histidine kinase KdpD